METNELASILAELIKSEVSPEAQEIRNILLRRAALESDIKPSRIPAPLNITEIGGYINQLSRLDNSANAMQRQLLASILGLPMDTPL